MAKEYLTWHLLDWKKTIYQLDGYSNANKHSTNTDTALWCTNCNNTLRSQCFRMFSDREKKNNYKQTDPLNRKGRWRRWKRSSCSWNYEKHRAQDNNNLMVFNQWNLNACHNLAGTHRFNKKKWSQKVKIRVLITITMNQHMNWTRSCVFFFSLFKYHRDVVRAQTNRNLPNSNRSDAFKYIVWYFGQMRSACIHFNVSTAMEDRINTCIQLENEYFPIKHLSFHLSRCFETDSNNPFQNPKRHIVRKASHISSPLKSMLNRRLQCYFHYTLFSTQREEKKKFVAFSVTIYLPDWDDTQLCFAIEDSLHDV